MDVYFAMLCFLAASFTISLRGLLPNGDFESLPNSSQLIGTRVDGLFSIPNWETRGYVEYIKSGYKQGDMLLVVSQGKHALRLGNDASIRQKIKMVMPESRRSASEVSPKSRRSAAWKG